MYQNRVILLKNTRKIKHVIDFKLSSHLFIKLSLELIKKNRNQVKNLF